MGGTCALVWITRDRLYTATVGDFRIYLLRSGKLIQLSTDHTWIQEALERGILTADEARGYPNTHVIRRYLGSPKPPEIDFRMQLSPRQNDIQAENNQGVKLLPNDTLLLCSDGLTDVVSPVEIQATLEKHSVEQAARTLVDLANKHGGPDNITAIVINVPKLPHKKHILRHFLIALAIIALLVLAGYWLGSQYIF
jgi:protein phosphatase